MSKLHSAACERNRAPIGDVLRIELPSAHKLLEIGSGTGQHAAYFAAELPHLIWQTSDLASNHPSIQAWVADAGLPNLLPPLHLDVGVGPWPEGGYDAVFSANTCHIMSWNEVQAMFTGIGGVLEGGGTLCIYGPFNYRGTFTSDSNARFDAMLRTQAPHMGIRDFEAVDSLAGQNGLRLIADHDMPANNRLLVWRKQP